MMAARKMKAMGNSYDPKPIFFWSNGYPESISKSFVETLRWSRQSYLLS